MVVISDWGGGKHELATLIVDSECYCRFQSGQSTRAAEACVYGY